MSDSNFSLHGFALALLRSVSRPALPVRNRGRWTYIRLTRPGFVFAGMLLILLFGSLNHANNLGFLLTFLLGSIGFVSLFHTLRNVSGIVPVSIKAEPVFAGQNAFFAVAMQLLSRSRTALSLSFPGGEPAAVDLGADGGRTISVLHPTRSRGLLKPPFLTVSTTYPLGLFRVWTRLPIDASCLIYPKPIAGPFITMGCPADGDDDSGGENGGAGVDDFTGLEAYRRGDPLQHISWKALSRGQGLHTKKFEGQQGRNLCFDPDVLPGNDLEEKLSRICAMVLKAETLGLTYGLRLGDRFIDAGQGGSHKRLCLQELALAWK
jgi:uncharacterized protein (DUF58 family)